jgi:hypothetical protein
LSTQAKYSGGGVLALLLFILLRKSCGGVDGRRRGNFDDGGVDGADDVQPSSGWSSSCTFNNSTSLTTTETDDDAIGAAVAADGTAADATADPIIRSSESECTLFSSVVFKKFLGAEAVSGDEELWTPSISVVVIPVFTLNFSHT